MTTVPTFAPAPRSGPAPGYVRSGEEIVWMGRPTLSLLVSQGLGLVTSLIFLTVFLTSFAARAGNAQLGWSMGGVALLFVVLLVLQGLRLRRTQYIVTRQSIYTRTGIIGETVIQTTFDKITDISLKQDVVGRILGFSALHVNTAGSGTPPVRMDGLRNALEMKSLIEGAREQFLRRGEPGATTSRPRVVPRFVPDRLLVAFPCPTTLKALKRPRAEIGKIVPCPHCGKNHIVKEVLRGDGA